ncbi:phosphoenolpyruvate-protein phosphotransferase [Candidatus Magnetomorum sp. HK-1]|nr:phosphoenolpyruvate-protein phosphotransferase [Candidatus Magnetomorum sp. HK-1]
MERDDIRILEDIGKILTESVMPEKILEKMVSLIAKRFQVDVCSIYLINIEGTHLILDATFGLNPDMVGQLKMEIKEGLTGLTLEKMTPVFSINPKEHKRFKFFEDSGEEIYQTFLGIPLVYLQRPVGVMVLQTRDEKSINEKDIPIFSTIAVQISTVVAYSGLFENFMREKKVTKNLKKKLSPKKKKYTKKSKQTMLRGIPVSKGIARGHVHYFGECIGFDMVEYEETDNIQDEINQIEAAFHSALTEIKNMAARVKDLSGEDDAIVESHIMLLKDPSFKKKILNEIHKGIRASSALKNVVTDYLQLFSKMDDIYLKERAADIEDIGRRVLRNLLGIQSGLVGELSKDTILITSDISPIDLVGMKQDRLKAIVLSKGGRTSHAVILAKSFAIPMVIGVREILETVKEDDFVIVDGNSGLVYKKPPKLIIEEYDRLIELNNQQSSELEGLKSLQSITLDNFCVNTGANIGMISDLALMERYGADHIGLYRTEFPFLIRKDLPSEEEQFELYKKIILGAKGKPVTIRTLDVGGDKFLSFLDYPKEENPFLGWRSIRVSLELEEIFITQIRAIFRAACAGDVRILFPMISCIDEIRLILKLINAEKQKLHEEKIDFCADIPIGIMVEVPGIVRILDRVMPYVDFISVGTNDLIQYMLAVDRNNEKVANLYNPLHPSIIEIIRDVAVVCQKNNKSVSICGESAANIHCAYLFVGMGIDNLSMNSVSVPMIKKMIRQIKKSDAEEDLKKVLKMEEAREIKNFLNGVLWQWPE